MEITPERRRPFLLQDRRAQLSQILGVGNAVSDVQPRELDVAAKGNPGDPPLGALLVMPGHQPLAEADGEPVDGHAAQARDKEVPELVHRDHEREHAEERQRVGQPVGQRGLRSVKHWALLSP